MNVTEKEVAYVAGLASLDLTAEERGRMVRDLNSILGYIDTLNELDTANVEPMAQVMAAAKGLQWENGKTGERGIVNASESQRDDVLGVALGKGSDSQPERAPASFGSDSGPQRDDILRPSLSHQDAMSNAPDADANFFKVPKVIER